MRYFNPIVGYSFPSAIPIDFIPSNDGYSQANPTYVMQAEMDHFNDLYTWLSGKELKQKILTEVSKMQKKKDKKSCEAATMFLVKTLLLTEGNKVKEKSRMTYDEGTNAPHTLPGDYPNVFDYLFEMSIRN